MYSQFCFWQHMCATHCRAITTKPINSSIVKHECVQLASSSMLSLPIRNKCKYQGNDPKPELSEEKRKHVRGHYGKRSQAGTIRRKCKHVMGNVGNVPKHKHGMNFPSCIWCTASIISPYPPVVWGSGVTLLCLTAGAVGHSYVRLQVQLTLNQCLVRQASYVPL